ncbi:MAG: pseudouridine synthase [Acidimicrobiales bacterium]|nr:MAG: pseudouridine synthase [Acidimicrobiales bacterium]
MDDPDLVLRFWKPHGVMTAFTDRDGRETLADHIDVPDVYAAGRLDRDSEGLLLLTRGKNLRTRLMRPDIGHPRTYLVQVEGVPDDAACRALERGVDLKDGRTRPATVEQLATPPDLPERRVPIRVRKSIPDSWMRLTLTEGRNRQVRRMTAAVGFPTLRLVRERIGPIDLDGLTPGSWEPLAPEAIAALRASLTEAEGSSPPQAAPRRRGRRSRG